MVKLGIEQNALPNTEVILEDAEVYKYGSTGNRLDIAILSFSYAEQEYTNQNLCPCTLQLVLTYTIASAAICKFSRSLMQCTI